VFEEESVAKLAGGLARRVRDGEFTLYRNMQ
jgi:hypothetical protein